MKTPSITKEFPKGKENYCPRCYFENEKVILREDCPHNKSITKEILKKGHKLYAEFANVPLGKRAEWLENLVKDTYEAGRAYWEPSEYHKDIWRKEARQSTISEIIELLPEEKPEIVSEELPQTFGLIKGFNSCRQIIIEKLNKLK